MLSEELLAVVRRATGRDDVTYDEEPVRFTGGFFTENHAFRLADAPAPWDGALVLRLFPLDAPDDLAHREAAVQRVLVAQGYPAPPVVYFDDGARLAGRHYFVMERMPGKPLLGGIRVGELLRSGAGIFRRMVEMTVDAQAQLHRLDAEPLAQALGDAPAGVERWFERLSSQAETEFDGLAAGLAWLVDRRPQEASSPVICHGDLWAGNILADGDRLTGVIDYTVATIAEPALEVGFTAMGLRLAPIDAPAPIQKLAARISGSLCNRYVAGYLRATGADLSNQSYYEALRCASELTNVVAYRLARARGVEYSAPRPTWDSIGDTMTEFFRARTGVALKLPPPV